MCQGKVPCGCPSLQSPPPAKKFQDHPSPYGMTMSVSCNFAGKGREMPILSNWIQFLDLLQIQSIFALGVWKKPQELHCLLPLEVDSCE